MKFLEGIKRRRYLKKILESAKSKVFLCNRAKSLCYKDCENCAWMLSDEEITALTIEADDLRLKSDEVSE